MAVQAFISLAIIYYDGENLHKLANLICFGYLSSVITIFAVIGYIHAFNMIDGIDGLLGGLKVVTFASLGILFSLVGEQSLSYLCLLFVIY